MRVRGLWAGVALIFLALSTPFAQAQQIDPSFYSGMRWRSIGPYRAGRVTAVAGIPGNPAVYYMGTPGGGVWKTTDGGVVWEPIFDQEHVASIGALAIAASNPNILYVGTGEQTVGNGVYKSTDAGATWTNIGLLESRRITSIIVDPVDPNIVLAGAPAVRESLAGYHSAPGVFRSTDGGKTWNRVLSKDETTGVEDMCADPGNRHVLYAALQRAPSFPPEEGAREEDAWIYKSEDEGATWKPLPGSGLPSGPLGRVGIAVGPGDKGRRVYAITGPGLFRSDDAGATWRLATKDPRVKGSGYFSRVFVDPRNADVVYVMQTCMYRSTDGGQTFVAYKGAPGGDDNHVLWIDPENSRRMILGADQGATVSLDEGKTWSSWFNQPTGQFYNVTTDNQFPYYVYASQQDSGTVAVPNRSDYGEISFRDWFSVGGFEFCNIAPDPLNPNIVYSGGWYGSVVRFDKTTGQITHVFARSAKYRTGQRAPLIFSPQDPHTLYFATQYVMKTTEGGGLWQTISPDLTERPAPAGEKKAQERQPRPPAAINTLAVSALQAGVLWAGTRNGLIQRTVDGGISWQNVSPADFAASTSVVALEASHHDAGGAYAAVFVSRDVGPYVYRTHDGGKSWQKITDGIPAEEHVWVVREDPVRRGLLYAGTENGVYVSFDDGDHWQSLQLNLPAATVRDMAVHDNDLAAATFGRALWILDDLSPLRQAGEQTAGANAHLLRPAPAIRVRWDNDQETPLPPEIPAGKNPPDGAILNYYLPTAPKGELTLEIHDARGKLVRRFSSVPPTPDNSPKNVPDYWFRSPAVLTKNPGLNRFVWDLRYDSPKVLRYSYYGNILEYTEYTLTENAIVGETPPEATLGTIIAPGEYEVTLVADGVTTKQPLTVTLDPRVQVSQSDLEQQSEAAMAIGASLAASYEAYEAAGALREAVTGRQKSLAENAQAKDASDAAKELDAKAGAAQNGTRTAPGLGPVNRDLARLYYMVESGDAAPTAEVQAAVAESCQALHKDLAEWRQINAQAVPSVNALLEKYKLAPLPVAANGSAAPTDGVCHE